MFRRRHAAAPVLPLQGTHFFWTLGSLAQLFRIPFDAQLRETAERPEKVCTLQWQYAGGGITAAEHEFFLLAFCGA